MHLDSEPAILYFGTPVVLVSTENKDGSFNLAPISSVFWLGWRCMIGLAKNSKTTENLIRTKECVLNLASVNEAEAVNCLALTTGSNPVPEGKRRRGYRYEPDKFDISGLTPMASGLVSAPGVKECPVQLEAQLISVHPIGAEDALLRGRVIALELKIIRVRLDESILQDGKPNYVDPGKWRPLIMSFQHFYGLGEKILPSSLAQIPEHLYKDQKTG